MKWNNYYKQYEKHFPVRADVVLEIGVKDGDGLLFLHGLYPDAFITGVDLEISEMAVEKCDHFARLIEDNQCSLAFPPSTRFDLIIDDGGHRPYQQVLSFMHLWPLLNDGGVYVIEDLHMLSKPRWKWFARLFPWLSTRHTVNKMLNEMSKWEGPEASGRRGPATEVIFSPQLVMIRKGTVEMFVE